MVKPVTLSLLFFSLFSLSSQNSDFSTLTSFKSSSDPFNSLSSWSHSSNFCSGSWLGVTCNPKNHRVTSLVLENLGLVGSIQVLTQLTHLRILSLKHNNLSSTLNFTSWPNLMLVYLTNNSFAGKFPIGIERLHRLYRLDLSSNRISGEIPFSDLTRLPHLLTLRLESNSFTGTLSASNFSSMVDFNVSYNNLTGKIPKFLSNFPVTSFIGNKNLCGTPLSITCLIIPAKAADNSVEISGIGEGKRSFSRRVVLLIISIDLAVIIAVVAVVVWCYFHWRRGVEKKEEREYSKNGEYDRGKSEKKMVFFDGCEGFSRVDQLLTGSAELLGKGSVGTTYKVTVDGGGGDGGGGGGGEVVVVVKRVRERRKKEIEGFLRDIGGLRNGNLVSLRAYYSSKHELLLVYDFLPNGSLYSLLHGNRGPGRTPLDWTTRLKLASGSASGLAFLHSCGKAKLFHGHLTSSNIIVDKAINACITYIGIHQLLIQTPLQTHNTYKAPESILNHQKLDFQKCDVYSFGVVLLEILTGKIASGDGETSLVMWVQRVVKEESIWELFDFELWRYKEMEDEMKALLHVALLCLEISPNKRPTMKIVHKMIKDIGIKSSEDGGVA